MSLNEIQLKVFRQAVEGLPIDLAPDGIEVVQTASYVDSPLHLLDYATGVVAAAGAAVSHLGELRGMPSQRITVDRRLAGLHFNDYLFGYLNGDTLTLDAWGMGADNGLYRTKDGKWFSYVGDTNRLRTLFLQYLDCAPSAEAVQRAVGRLNADELEQGVRGAGAGLAGGLPGAWLRTPEEWLSHPVGAYARDLPLIHVDRRELSRGRRGLTPRPRRPLSGVRVIDMSNVIANPHGARLLAELGADVISISPPTGDFLLATWLVGAWGKRNIRLDLKTDAGRSEFIRLLADADVFVDGHAPGAMERLGFDLATLYDINPSLVRTGVSFAPRGSEWGDRRGFEQIAQTVSGVAHLHSAGAEIPHYTPLLANDYGTAYLLLAGVTGALIQREADGGAWDVEISLINNAMKVAGYGGATETPEEFAESDLVRYLVDQESSDGTWTQFAPAIGFSDTPMGTHITPQLPGTSPRGANWLAGEEAPFEPPYYPSRLARQGAIRGFTPNFGVEDRCDGRGDPDLTNIFG